MSKSSSPRCARRPLSRAAQAVETLECRRLLASVSGVLYNDYNRNGIQDPDESGVAGHTVYADANNNGLFDAGEVNTVSDADGAYTLTGLPVGTTYIRTVLPPSWSLVTPAAPGATVAASADGTSLEIDLSGTVKTSYVAGEIIVAVVNRGRLDEALKKLANRPVRAAARLDQAGTLGESGGETLLQVPLAPGQDAEAVAKQYAALAGVLWAEPNYVYEAVADFVPNDPSYSNQYHHAKMQNPLAWDTARGEGVKIGVTDGGFLMNHPDLAPNYWVNPGEIAGNGIDDDGNGYIDDVSGWDFTNSTSTFKGDNNPSPASGDSDHGTHVAGIAAARMNNGIGVAGTAGMATIVPLRFAGSGSWTSTVVYNTYKYAADNGIKIVTTSYGVDGFATNSSTYVSAVNYLYSHGVLHLNSAGNDETANSARQRLGQTLYVASVNSNDIKATSSNWGWGIDLSSPGVSIYATGITSAGNATYETKSGTSMATPNAAGVAALIWSKNPTWTRDQVAAQLLGTTDNIDPLNPAFATQMGTGRVNSYRAVTETLGAPKFREVLGLPAHQSSTLTPPTTVRVRFFNVLDPATANSMANWKLVGAGPDGLFGTADDVNRTLILASTTGPDTVYRIGVNEFNFNIAGGALPQGRYRFIAVSGGANGLRDPFGTALDGNGDGVGGDDFVREFIIGTDLPGHLVNLQTPNAILIGRDFGLAETIGPRVMEAVFDVETGHELRFRFDEPVEFQGSASLMIINLSGGGLVDPSAYTLNIDAGAFTTVAHMNAPLPDGNYLVQLLASGVKDRFGNRLDANGDGIPGDSLQLNVFVLAGDANRDRVVNFDDLLIVAQNYGTTGKTFSQGNFDYSADGAVTFDDLLILAQKYGSGLAVVAETSPVRAPAPAERRKGSIELIGASL